MARISRRTFLASTALAGASFLTGVRHQWSPSLGKMRSWRSLCTICAGRSSIVSSYPHRC